MHKRPLSKLIQVALSLKIRPRDNVVCEMLERYCLAADTDRAISHNDSDRLYKDGWNINACPGE